MMDDRKVCKHYGVEKQSLERCCNRLKSVQVACSKKWGLKFFTMAFALFLSCGGALYSWPDQKSIAAASVASQNIGQEEQQQIITRNLDLSRAETYLPSPYLRCEFFANYPDGTSGKVILVSGHVAASRAIRVSEVEFAEVDGREVGYGFHYLQRAEGIYYIYDQTPEEAVPALQNNLAAGRSWQHENQFGVVVWRVLALGERVDLGFAILNDCVVIEEDNQAVGEKTITYYAPGLGRVLVKSPGGTEFMKLTAYYKIDKSEAYNIVKKWSPNYREIRVDRIQN